MLHLPVGIVCSTCPSSWNNTYSDESTQSFLTWKTKNQSIGFAICFANQQLCRKLIRQKYRANAGFRFRRFDHKHRRAVVTTAWQYLNDAICSDKRQRVSTDALHCFADIHGLILIIDLRPFQRNQIDHAQRTCERKLNCKRKHAVIPADKHSFPYLECVPYRHSLSLFLWYGDIVKRAVFKHAPHHRLTKCTFEQLM